VDLELHVGERPARGQIFQGRDRGGFDALGVKTAKTELVGERHGKTTAERGSDQFVWVSADAFGKTCSVRVLSFREHAAFGS